MPRVGSSSRNTRAPAYSHFAQHGLLLVAAAQVHHALIQAGRLDA